MIKSLDHLNIVVSDLEKSKNFFLRLGFSEGDSSHLSGEWVSAIVGLPNVEADYVALQHPGSSTNVELIHYKSPPSSKDASMSKANKLGYRHIAFSVDNIEEEVERLGAEGIEFLSPIKAYPKTGKKLAYFLGPDNILMELTEYPK